jgi:hypothetical protein
MKCVRVSLPASWILEHRDYVSVAGRCGRTILVVTKIEDHCRGKRGKAEEIYDAVP